MDVLQGRSSCHLPHLLRNSRVLANTLGARHLLAPGQCTGTQNRRPMRPANNLELRHDKGAAQERLLLLADGHASYRADQRWQSLGAAGRPMHTRCKSLHRGNTATPRTYTCRAVNPPQAQAQCPAKQAGQSSQCSRLEIAEVGKHAT